MDDTRMESTTGTPDTDRSRARRGRVMGSGNKRRIANSDGKDIRVVVGSPNEDDYYFEIEMDRQRKMRITFDNPRVTLDGPTVTIGKGEGYTYVHLRVETVKPVPGVVEGSYCYRAEWDDGTTFGGAENYECGDATRRPRIIVTDHSHLTGADSA